MRACIPAAVAMVCLGAFAACGEVPREASGAGSALQSPSMQLERARALHFHRGDAALAELICRSLIGNPQTTPFVRAGTTAFLAELLAHRGQLDAGVTLLEQYIAAQTRDYPWADFPGQGEINEMLKSLLLGFDFQADLVEVPIGEVGEAMTELAKQLPCDGTLQIYSFARSHRTTARLFLDTLFFVHNAYCKRLYGDKGYYVSQSHSSSQWTMIPYVASRMRRALNFFVHDAKAHPIPRRYAKYLPLDYAKMEQYLAENRGIVAIELGRGLPQFLLAAPDSEKAYKTISAFMAQDALPPSGLFVMSFDALPPTAAPDKK